MTRLVNAFRAWVPVAIAVTGLCGLAYVLAQQSLRQGANDPQIQMAEDVAASLDCCWTPEGAAAPKEQVDIARSLAPFFVVYDAGGKPIAGSGLLNGKLPDYPIGALQASKSTGENRVTWQPATGVRIASVVASYKNGYVVAGRNLRQVEMRVSQMGIITVLAWLATLVAVFAGTLVFVRAG